MKVNDCCGGHDIVVGCAGEGGGGVQKCIFVSLVYQYMSSVNGCSCCKVLTVVVRIRFLGVMFRASL